MTDIEWQCSVDNANLSDYPYGTALSAGTIVGGSGCLNDSSDATYLYTTGPQQVTARISPVSSVPSSYAVTGWGFSVRYKMAGPWPGSDPRGICGLISDTVLPGQVNTVLSSGWVFGNFSTSVVTSTYDRTSSAGDGQYLTSDNTSDLWLLFNTGTVSGYGDYSLWVYELTVTAHYSGELPLRQRQRDDSFAPGGAYRALGVSSRQDSYPPRAKGYL